jgi:hypothetical protein
MNITINIPQNLQIQLATTAKQYNLNLQDYIIQCLQNTQMTHIPNYETQLIIEDARSGKNMQKISLEKLKEMSDA